MKKKGISLIMLIITMVVIIIISTAIIVTLARTTIIFNANEAQVKYDFQILQEELDLYNSKQLLISDGHYKSKNLNANSTTNPSVYDILPSLIKTKYKNDVVIVNGKLAFKDTMNKQIKEWATEVVKDVEEVYEKTTINTIVTGSNATINGKKAKYNNPVIPVGFKAINTTDASWSDLNSDGKPDGWNDGLVIQDDDGNQFVWVPVDGTNVTYNKWCTKGYAYNDSNIKEVIESEMPIGVSENTQITKYGGFYIGRYEAGVPANQITIDGTNSISSDVDGNPQSKREVTVWTHISYQKANSNAKSYCFTDYVKSGLLTGTQWDTVCKWINNEKDSNNNSVHNVDDSRTWGNHGDSQSPANITEAGSKQTAGFSDYWKAKNIYDFAGNAWEWTNEAYSYFRIYRGGNSFNSAIPRNSASCRSYVDYFQTYDSVGFRLVLYIM